MTGGAATVGGASTAGGAASASQYRWPLFHDDPQLTGTSADPGLSTASAGNLGVRWMANLGASTLSSPMVAYNVALGKTLVFVGNEAGYFTAYDQATGLPVWSVQTGAPVRSSPLAEGGSVWVAPNRAFRLYKLNAATGAVECSAPTPMGLIVDATPTIATPPGGEPTVYIGVNDAGRKNGPLEAVKESDCTVDFTSAPEPLPGTGGSWDPISYGVDARGEGLVFFGTADPDSAVYAIDAITGKLVWRFAVLNPAPGTYDVGAGVTVSLPGVNGFADGVAYVASKYGIMYALDLTTGAPIWQYNFGVVDKLNPAGGISTAALSGRSLVFGTAGGVDMLNAITGAPIWRYQTGDTQDVVSSVAVVGPAANRVVAFTTLTGRAEVLSLASGARLYSYQTANYMVTSPADVNGNLVVTSADGYLYDFAPGGGNGPAPSTAATSPADGSTVPNPSGDIVISGNASGSSVAGVTVAVQRNGAAGQWWDSSTKSWTAAPYPNPATVASRGASSSTWKVSVPVPAEGANLEAFASAVDASGVADVSANQSAPTPARDDVHRGSQPPAHDLPLEHHCRAQHPGHRDREGLQSQRAGRLHPREQRTGERPGHSHRFGAGDSPPHSSQRAVRTGDHHSHGPDLGPLDHGGPHSLEPVAPVPARP